MSRTGPIPRPLAVANWKMNKLVGEAEAFVDELNRHALGLRGVDIAIAPSFTALSAVAERLSDAFRLAAQNLHTDRSGAFTGDVSGAMLADIGCKLVIVGHSERRYRAATAATLEATAPFGESDQEVGKKVRAAIAAGLVPIVCVGERLEERERGETFARIKAQMAGAFDGLRLERASDVVLAYEPVWAIGTGRNATPDQAENAHRFLREQLAERIGELANGVRILYGGSVKPENVADIAGRDDIDGVLVGGASLEVESFVAIAEAVARAREK